MTTDERLAALEAKMDALTAPPSDYYTSRYSGEEIDAAIAAVPGKAETAQLCNRNLLDNWYFGNPVDQRGGYVVLPGATYYDNTWTAVGTTTGYIKIDSIIPTGGAWITIGGTQYLVSAPSDSVVRGYVGAGYGIDRWFAGSPGTVVTVQSDHVSIAPPAGNYFGWITWFEADSLLGQTVTFSALCRCTGSGGTILPYITAYIGDNQYVGAAQINQTAWQCVSFTITFPTDKPSDGCFGLYVVAMQNFGVDVKAAKLELGSTQTLAHQDENGNWVLNEIPDYGEQLRRCQRYFVRFGFPKPNYCTLGTGIARSSTSVSIPVPLPNNLRAIPAITITGYVTLRNSDTSMMRSSATRLDALGVGAVLLYFAASGVTAGDVYEAFLEPENYLDVSADL